MQVEPPPPARSFLAELKKRRVPQTALWYVGGAVALVEAADIFFPSLGVPAGAVRLLAIVAAFGLPVALTLAWSFDVSAAEEPAQRRRHHRIGLVALLAVTTVSVAGAYAVWVRAPAADDAQLAAKAALDPEATHIAVLPFTVVGDDPALAAFASHLQARLIDGLSMAATQGTPGAKRLRVLSYASVLPFSRAAAPIDSIRRALDVGTLLDGSVEPAGDAVRVRLRLVDTRTGDQLAAAVAEARANDRVGLLDAVADSVVRLVRKQLGTIMLDRVRWLETRNGDAFDLVLWASQQQGDEFRTAFAARDYARAQRALDRADSLYAEAEKLDPQWIEPILERARQTERRVMLAQMRGSGDVARIFETGLAHAERAVRLKPNDPRPLGARGYLHRLRVQLAPPDDRAEARRIAEAAERDLRASLIGSHTPATALRLLSELAGEAGRYEEAIDYGVRAIEEDRYLQQIERTIFRLFEYSLALGRDADAVRYCADGHARFDQPIFDDCRLTLGAWTTALPLAPDSAWRLVEKELAVVPAPIRPRLEPRLHAMTAAVLVRAGRRDSAHAVLKRARAQDDRTGGFLRAAAGVYGLLGMPDSATAMIKRLPDDQYAERSLLSRAPELRGLRLP